MRPTYPTDPVFTDVSDHAVLVEFGTTIDASVTLAVQALDRSISEKPPEGVCEVIPALVNLLVMFDPLLTDHQSLKASLEQIVSVASSTSRNPETHTVEVCFDGDYAPDLSSVALACGVTNEDCISAFLSAGYTVGMYGFAPGYAYLGGVPSEIQVPRKPAAVRDVPKGSVLIAGSQCLVTTLTMPTGWAIIGRSPTQILQEASTQPFLFNVGDSVNFAAIDRDLFVKRLSTESEFTEVSDAATSQQTKRQDLTMENPGDG